MSSDEELEKLRQRRVAELQAQRAQQGQAAQVQAQELAEAQREAIMRKILTPEARARLQNVKLVRPDFAEQVEMQLIQVAQTGRVPLPITDDLLKRLLAELQSQQAKRDISIRRI